MRIRSNIASSTLYIWDLYVDEMAEGTAPDVVYNGNLQIGYDNGVAFGYGKKLTMSGVTDNTDVVWMSKYNVSSDNTEFRLNIGDDGGDRFIVGYTNWQDQIYKKSFIVRSDGHIGIGTENINDAMLTVAGSIKAREVKIEINSGADFVFHPQYPLQALNEVETFVKSNNHLPGIPSEKEMQEKGLNINEFQIKLLQKIEELTLYMIQQQKEIESLKKELKDSKAQK